MEENNDSNFTHGLNYIIELFLEQIWGRKKFNKARAIHN